MSKSIRIRTTPNGSDSNIKVKIEQDFDFIEILSLKISQAEAYSRFCSDYGVVVGRVIINDGFGVPNAKVSVFVPIEEEDELDSEIAGLYPYKVLGDKNSDGIRYNLLQKDPKPNENCFTPAGSFPSKREVIDNDTVLEVYDKYYKYTTTTNEAGDFMLFGVPVGSHTLNMDCDLSDIGIASQRPYDYISQGESIKRFESTTKFKSDKDLDKMIQIKSYRKGINVQPFWGDKDQCDIGITRSDFDIKKKIIPSAIFVGSLFSDSEKNSINKNCRPRKDLGRLCETNASEGTVEMIRKTLDGTIERFDVEGGRVIDDSGGWAYQVPMNLDYMVTNEFGELVPSDDPNKGIPTKARVRFRIGMDVTGDEGRLRTSAKYLVPHNPPNSSNIDYNFNENTSDEHFRDFHWNKIYTVSNFIPRVQSTCPGGKCADNRNITGIKDVDDCSGDKTPFPYNRVDTDFNPLFLILCIILNIIIFIVWMINAIVINLINVVLIIINAVLLVICEIVFFISKIVCALKHLTDADKRAECREKGCMGDCDDEECKDCECKNILSYVPCIVMECDDKNWAPGCKCDYIEPSSIVVGSNDYGNTDTGAIGCWASMTNAENPKNPITHWSGVNYNSDNCSHPGHDRLDAGLSDCYAIQLAEALNMFELDFYNDWINGTLYAYLLKYKKKKNGKQKFCDSDCDTSDSDNNCDKSWFVDTCTSEGSDRIDTKKIIKKQINEGLIKQVTTTRPDGKEDEVLYYAPYTKHHDFKMFATELVHLGSIFDCDWQGIPKIQSYLLPTSYIRPPYTAEYLNDGTTKVTCGMTSTGTQGSGGLFFDIDCIGLKVGGRCKNFKRICEIGVELPSDNCWVLNESITNPYGSKFRDIFYALNKDDGANKLNSWPVGGIPVGGYGTAFETASGEGFASDSLNAEYVQFRGNYISTDTDTANVDQPVESYSQSKNSFYFYFGTEPGKSGLETMNNRFFAECAVVQKNDFVIQGIVTDSTSFTGCTGEINLTIVGGSGDYTYVWTGPNGYTSTESTANNEDGDIQGLCGGIYTVVVTDTDGGSSTTSFTVNAPTAFACDVTAVPAIQAGVNGSIILNIAGGVPNYSYSINNNPSILMTGSYENIPLPEGTYNVEVTDTNNNSCTDTVTISASTAALNIAGATTGTNTTCGNDNGTLTVTIDFQTLGGAAPYSYLITGPNGFSSSSLNLTNLEGGTYTIQVTDSSPTPQVVTDTWVIAPSIGPTMSIIPDWFCWLAPNTTPTITPSFNVTANGGYTIEWVGYDALGAEVLGYSGSTTFPAGVTNPIITSSMIGPYGTNFKLIDSFGCIVNDYYDLRPGQGHVPTSAMAIEYIPEQYCWLDGSTPQIYPQFLVTVDGPFTISWAGGSESFAAVGVPTIITLSTLVSVGNINFTLTETNNGCTNLSGVIDLTAGGSNVPSSALSGIATQPNQTTITVTPTGGWGGYTYKWFKNGVDMGITTQSHTINAFSNGEDWQCKITDSNGCFTYSNIVTTT